MTSGVLFTDTLEDENYHILTPERCITDCLYTDRTTRNINSNYNKLYQIMVAQNLTSLWVYPETQLSMWTNRTDFDNITGMSVFTPVEEKSRPGIVMHPKGVRLGDGQDSKFVFFPAYMDMARTYLTMGGIGDIQHSRDNHTWLMPSPQTLLHTVQYIEEETGIPLLWSPGYSSSRMLARTHSHHKKIVPYMDNAHLWKDISTRVIMRPSWKHYRQSDGKPGLTDEQKKMGYIIGGDKNVQYLGACVGLELGNGEPTRELKGSVLESFFQSGELGLWQYTLQDVKDSLFNGYDCYCPLSNSRNWASTDVLTMARKVGISFQLNRGVIWEEKAGKALERWAIDVWKAKEGIKNKPEYDDSIAALNADATMKKYYLDLIGRLCASYSREYYHRDWNIFVIHRAIMSQLNSIAWRMRKASWKYAPVLVNMDSFYFLSDEPIVSGPWSDILKNKDEMRGFKLIGVSPLTENIIAGFEEMQPDGLEALIKAEMKGYKVHNDRQV